MGGICLGGIGGSDLALAILGGPALEDRVLGDDAGLCARATKRQFSVWAATTGIERAGSHGGGAGLEQQLGLLIPLGAVGEVRHGGR